MDRLCFKSFKKEQNMRALDWCGPKVMGFYSGVGAHARADDAEGFHGARPAGPGGARGGGGGGGGNAERAECVFLREYEGGRLLREEPVLAAELEAIFGPRSFPGRRRSERPERRQRRRRRVRVRLVWLPVTD